MKVQTWITILCIALSCPSSHTNGQERPVPDDVVLQRLDAILNRLTAIEDRLAKLEKAQRSVGQWSVDERGVLRTLGGRAIGFWGIDVLPSAAERR